MGFPKPKIENFDSSWISLSADETDLMCIDPVAAAQALKRAINRLTDDYSLGRDNIA